MNRVVLSCPCSCPAAFDRKRLTAPVVLPDRCTATTVGYGDHNFVTEGGKVVAILHIFTLVILLSEAISSWGEIHKERQEIRTRLDQIQRTLNPAMLHSFFSHAAQLRASDKDLLGLIGASTSTDDPRQDVTVAPVTEVILEPAGSIVHTICNSMRKTV